MALDLGGKGAVVWPLGGPYNGVPVVCEYPGASARMAFILILFLFNLVKYFGLGGNIMA